MLLACIQTYKARSPRVRIRHAGANEFCHAVMADLIVPCSDSKHSKILNQMALRGVHAAIRWFFSTYLQNRCLNNSLRLLTVVFCDND